MAKKKKRSGKLNISLRYEIYGILILMFSVIALSGQNPFSHAVFNICSVVIGKLHFVIPILFIYIGLYAMIKRSWPTGWSTWKSGLLLLLLALMLNFEISMIKQRDVFGELTDPAFILNQTWGTIQDFFGQKEVGLLAQSGNIGGGMVGALVYAVLYFLFGSIGSKIIDLALFVISFLLITGMSLVDFGGKMRGGASGLTAGIRNRLIELFGGARARMRRVGRGSSAKRAITIPDDDELEEDDVVIRPAKAKKPKFYELLPSGKSKPEQALHAGDALHEEARPAVGAQSVAADDPPWRQTDAEESLDTPAVHDFMDEVRAQPALDGPAATAAPPVAFGQTDVESDGAEVIENRPPAKPYQLPSLQLLVRPSFGKAGDTQDYRANARKLEATLESFGVRAKVLDVVRGPAVTRYEIQPDVGVKVSRIVSLTDDIALALAAKDIRMEAPIPGKSAIGIEVPNSEVSTVTLREVMESPAFQDSDDKLSITLGRDIAGKPIVANLAKMPHLLVAGATGSGKSVCVNGIITSILFKAKPDEVKFLMVDPKMVELNVYNGIPHLLAPVVTDPRRASLALKKIVVEMEKRYEMFSKSGTRNIEGYNTWLTDANNPNRGEPLPLIVVIVDELADLMMVAANDVEDAIIRLAQMARAAGIHLIIATQRPSVDVITGVIKANIPSRIAFSVSSQVDSRTILDMAGAEKLLGRGDMLFLPVGASKPVRVQGAFLSDQEVESVVTFCSNQEKANYQEELVPMVDEQADAGEAFEDELYDQAVQIVLEAKQASVSLLQRRMRVGYTRAARLIDTMEAKGVVGPYEGSKPREVLLGRTP